MPRRVLTSTWVPAVGVLLLTSLVLSRFGVPWPDVGRYLAYLAVCVALPGVFTWRLLLQQLHDDDPTPTWFEDLTLGTIFGFGVQLPFHLLGVAVGAPAAAVLLLPGAVLALSVLPFGRRVWALPTGRLPAGPAWGLSAIASFAIAWLWRASAHLAPLHLPRNKAMSADEVFHQALVAEVAQRFPPETPYLTGTRLEYHWFVHAQIAASRAVTGLDSPTMLRVVLPAVMLLLGLSGLGAVALRLTGRPLATAVAPALMTAGAYHLLGPDVDTYKAIDTYISARFLLSPSHAYGVMMSMPVTMLVLEVLRPARRVAWPVWMALVVSLLALSGSKATYLPTFLCGAVAAWFVSLLVRRRVDPAPTLLMLALVGATAFSQYVILGGRTGSMRFEPFATVDMIGLGLGLEPGTFPVTLMAVTLLVSWLLYGAGVVGLGRRHVLDPRVVWMVVAVAAGITVPFVFYRDSMAQLWFSRGVAPLVILASVWGLTRLLPRPLSRRQGLGLCAVAAGSAVAAFLVGLLLAVRRQEPGSADATAMSVMLLLPLLVVGGYLLARRVSRGARANRGWTTAVAVTVLLALSSGSVVNLAYNYVSNPTPKNRGRSEIFAPGGGPAADYLRASSSRRDVVATNVHCADPKAPECGIRSFWVAAQTERPVVIEGWGYTALANEMTSAAATGGEAEVPRVIADRLAINDAVFLDPTTENLRRLVDAYDVSWLFVSKEYPVDLAGLRELTGVLHTRFENANYLVLEVGD